MRPVTNLLRQPDSLNSRSVVTLNYSLSFFSLSFSSSWLSKLLRCNQKGNSLLKGRVYVSCFPPTSTPETFPLGCAKGCAKLQHRPGSPTRHSSLLRVYWMAHLPRGWPSRLSSLFPLFSWYCFFCFRFLPIVVIYLVFLTVSVLLYLHLYFFHFIYFFFFFVVIIFYFSPCSSLPPNHHHPQSIFLTPHQPSLSSSHRPLISISLTSQSQPFPSLHPQTLPPRPCLAATPSAPPSLPGTQRYIIYSVCVDSEPLLLTQCLTPKLKLFFLSLFLLRIPSLIPSSLPPIYFLILLFSFLYWGYYVLCFSSSRALL